MITKVIRDRKVQPVSGVKDFKDFASKNSDLSLYVQSGTNSRFVHLSKPAK